MLKIDLSTLPQKMAELPRDQRGYPVPWFVAWHDGKPEFRAMDTAKFILAIRQQLCWVCGGRMAAMKCFVAGPMCGINRTSSEPPSHPECGRWSARNCPFLANPRAVRREDEFINSANLRDNSAGVALSRNPGVAMLYFTRYYDIFLDEKGGPLFEMGSPIAIEWWCEGRPATRAEVVKSIDEGLPALERIAAKDPGGMEALAKMAERFDQWLPR